MQRCNRRSLKDTESPKLGSGSCGHTCIPNAIGTAVNPQKRGVCPNDSSGNQPQRESADDCSVESENFRWIERTCGKPPNNARVEPPTDGQIDFREVPQ